MWMVMGVIIMNISGVPTLTTMQEIWDQQLIIVAIALMVELDL